MRKGPALSAGAFLISKLQTPKDEYSVELLITQAARLADRLEVIARLLGGEPKAWLAVEIVGQVVEVRVTGLVQEERQLSEVLRKVIMDIQRMRNGKGGNEGGVPKQDDTLARIVAEHYGRKHG